MFQSKLYELITIINVEINNNKKKAELIKMESQEEVKISEEDVIELLGLFTKVPSLILKSVINGNLNVVKSFESQIEDYRNKLSDDEMLKIEKVLKTPVPELQKILYNCYKSTNNKQMKLLADPNSEPFIEKNLKELEKLMFNQ